MKCRKSQRQLEVGQRCPQRAGNPGRVCLVSGALGTASPRRISSQRGVALVLTLIMLAIITIVTVVFLATATRSRKTTTLRKDQTDAQFAAEAAFQRAMGEGISNMVGFTFRVGANVVSNPSLMALDFFVSRPGIYGTNGTRPTNENAIPVVLNDRGTVDVYLDLNRNGQFDDPGYGVAPVAYDAAINRPFGDPIWVGLLDKPFQPHGPNNRFVARMAYVVVPAGKQIDLNTIHNALYQNGYNFRRADGLGPWELNLAAMLHEFSPTIWDYSFGPAVGALPSGVAFEDAKSIVDSRNDWRNNPLQFRDGSAAGSFVDAPAYLPNSLDYYLDGFTPAGDLTSQAFPNSWPGAETTNHFFNVQELFAVTNVYNPNKVTLDFYSSLTNAAQLDPLMYYRLVSQLGTDTGSDFENRLNLNWADKHAAGYTNLSATNFVSWDATPELAVSFFTNVAERIFRAQFDEFNPINGTNRVTNIWSMSAIPVYPTNYYSTAIHRILQVAANIYDATRTNPYPSVFRPLFGPGPVSGVNYIVGYTNDDRVSTLESWLDRNTNGIPLVVGAKKGFPNFNEFTVRSDITVTRKLQVRKDGGQVRTNQMYVLGISNQFCLEAWNSYYRRYSRPATLTVSNFSTMWLSNGLGFQLNDVLTSATTTNIAANTWNGAGNMRLNAGSASNSFLIPFCTNQIFLSNAVYRMGANVFANVSTNDFEDDLSGSFPLPYWVFAISNRVSYLMSEQGRIIDFVLLNDNHVVDLHRDLVAAEDPYQAVPGTPSTIAAVWNTNRVSPNGPTRGIQQQMQISLGIVPTANADWRSFALTATASENDKTNAIDAFRVFNGLAALGTSTVPANATFAMETPFNPAAKLSALTTWQANDPLVHYHVQDLRMGPSTNHQYLKPTQVGTNITPSSLGRINDIYSPWGGRPNSSADDGSFYDRKVKDAGIYTSDEWLFPTNKLPSIGLLGRVHRGTPWQTIFLKPEAAPLTGQTVGWTNFSADIAVRANGSQYSRTHPTNDWRLMDMFTAGLEERTSRGLVSVNQTNLESWSALFSGLVVSSNSSDAPIIGEPRPYTDLVIEPWGSKAFGASQFAQIWSNIYWFQTNYARPMESVGDLLQLPVLTIESPFLNLSPDQVNWGIDDYAYEQIPQQILPLLRVGEARFVIYAYGQALKPAEIDPSNGRVSNYQVTAEYATRTVVRIEGNPRTRVRAVVESFNVLPPD